jgi:hypothetical protein
MAVTKATAAAASAAITTVRRSATFGVCTICFAALQHGTFDFERVERVGARIPDFDTEQEPPLEGPPTLVDVELQAPIIPSPVLAFTDRTQQEEQVTDDLLGGPTLDLPDRHAASPQAPAVFATWEESREIVVGPVAAPSQSPDDSPALRRKIQWITIALAASLAAQVGGFAGDRFLPAIIDGIRSEEVTYQRVWKSARSIESARRLGVIVSDEISELQRAAERATFSGDAELAKKKIEEINERWAGRGRSE